MITTGVTKTTLANGLTVLLKESHRAPVGSFWVWYRVGSRNEHTGITGISHWVEHMMFRGTERFPRGMADRLIARVGGYHNAMTYLDWTTYFQTLPVDELELAVQIEADRMLNAAFAPEDAELERTVIISERQGAENFPSWLLQEELGAAAFKVHPYRHMTIGWKSDLEAITRDDLYRHYQSFYAPNNAIIVAVGDFDSDTLLESIRAAFGPVPAGPVRPAVRGVEPTQQGERRVRRVGPGDTAYLSVAYHVPPATHPDFFPLVVVDTLLGGARSMSIMDDGEPSRTSRLYKALVDTGLAAEAGSFLLPTIDPYLAIFSATVQEGRTLGEVEAALLAEVQTLIDEPVDASDLRKAVHQTRAQFVYSAESVTSQGFWLGLAESVADLAWLDGFLDSLATVTTEDVQRVARVYLTERNRTVGWYEPEEVGEGWRAEGDASSEIIEGAEDVE